MSESITWAKTEDAPHLKPLMAALYKHETPDRSVPTDDIITAHIARLLDHSTPHRLAIAWDEPRIAIGLAAVATFISVSEPSAELSKQMELKELFVLPDHRSLGVGRALVEWVETRAVEQNVCRIDWHVKAENKRGIRFYETFGARIVESRISMRKTLR